MGYDSDHHQQGADHNPGADSRAAALQPGHILRFDETAPFLKAQRVFDEKRARSVLGCAKNAMRGYTAEKWLSETRGRRVRLRK